MAVQKVSAAQNAKTIFSSEYANIIFFFLRIMYFMKMSNVDPSTAMMGEAFAAAQGMPSSPDGPNKKSTAWPILVFLGFIFTAPYLIMKLLGTVSTTALEESEHSASPHTSFLTTNVIMVYS